MDVTSVQSWAEFVGLLIGAGTVLAAIWKYVARPLWRWGKSLSTTTERVERIWNELQPNGGSSIRDQITRLNDMTSRIETRQLVRDQLDRHVFAALSLGVFYTDAAGRCTEVNLHYCRLTGRTSEESLGLDWMNYIHPEDRNVVIEEWEDCMKEHRVFDRVYRFVRPDGMIQRVQGRACPLFSKEVLTQWFGTIEKLGEPVKP